jgi:hypothetical protein
MLNMLTVNVHNAFFFNESNVLNLQLVRNVTETGWRNCGAKFQKKCQVTAPVDTGVFVFLYLISFFHSALTPF